MTPFSDKTLPVPSARENRRAGSPAGVEIKHGRQRASEKVLGFLESEALFPDREASEIRLIPVRELAKQLKVSVSTIVSVYRTLSASGRIRTQAGNGSFLLPPPSRAVPVGAVGATSNAAIRIAVNVAPQNPFHSESWTYHVYGGLTVAALQRGAPVTIVPIDPGLDSPGLERLIEGCSAVIVIPGGWLHREIAAAAKAAGIPIIFFNPAEDGVTTNFVTADFYGTGKRLGQAFVKAGRKNILMVQYESLEKSFGSRLSLVGLLAGLNFGTSNGVRFNLAVTSDEPDIGGGRKAMSRFLDENRTPPDAIYCTGDYLALGVLEELRARGIDVPGQTSVVGGSGLELEGYHSPQLTRCRQPFGRIGERMVGLVQKLAESREKRVPGEIVPMGWIAGETTLPVENQFLLQGAPSGPDARV